MPVPPPCALPQVYSPISVLQPKFIPPLCCYAVNPSLPGPTRLSVGGDQGEEEYLGNIFTRHSDIISMQPSQADRCCTLCKRKAEQNKSKPQKDVCLKAFLSNKEVALKNVGARKNLDFLLCNYVTFWLYGRKNYNDFSKYFLPHYRSRLSVSYVNVCTWKNVWVNLV